MKKWTIGLTLCFCLSSTSAFAITFNFKDPLFSAAFNQSSFLTTIDGIEITITAIGEEATLWWDEVDGFGIQSTSYENDEIEGDERFELRFSTPIIVSSIFFTDLFNEHGYLETGWYQLGNTDPIAVTADPTQLLVFTNGELTLTSIPSFVIDVITFSAPGRIGDQHHEFSVGGIEIQQTPEPGTLVLLGSGMAGLLAWRRRRQILQVKA